MTKIAVVIPSYRVKRQILDVIAGIGEECSEIYVVDDKCPEGSGHFVAAHVKDPRVSVIYNEENRGVGGAVMAGYQAALANGADIVVKVDGDGQMDPRLIPHFVGPILAGNADYTKGNRFYSIFNVRTMPSTRLLGNAILSMLTKLSSGYWNLFDPTNGYTAIHEVALRQLELNDISERYFFESDMLVGLGRIHAVVVDIPMEAVYGGETSNLKIWRILTEFWSKHFKAIIRRILYDYFLRDFSLMSIYLLLSIPLMLFGVVFGGVEWWRSVITGVPATTGSVMVAMLPIILGFQLFLSFLGYDISNVPTLPLQRSALADQGALLAHAAKTDEHGSLN